VVESVLLGKSITAYVRRKYGGQDRDEGCSETLVEMIFALLEVRGIEVDDATAARVRACNDLDQLECWARRAREVQSSTELFTSD
jgi:hypothetical protein